MTVTYEDFKFHIIQGELERAAKHCLHLIAL